MEDTSAHDVHVIVLCPSVAPEAHGPGCPARHHYIPPQPGEPGDWSGDVRSLSEIRELFPSARVHRCLEGVFHAGA
ncbi:hypothetical protein GCM10010466_08940 [Planomonospora alba]|uniref:Uncharacterized protein n=1 Tax=Planomonospora alba TaxID=161354 RepID=A0ABP6MQH2_9ACTN